MKKLETSEENAKDSRLRLSPSVYTSGKEYLLSDHKPVGLTVSLKVLREGLEHPVHFLPPVEWRTGRDCLCQFSILGDEIWDRWSWIGVFRADFASLADFATWNYATNAVAKKNEDENSAGKKVFDLTFYAKYLSSQGDHVLVYVSKNSVVGLSEVFNVG